MPGPYHFTEQGVFNASKSGLAPGVTGNVYQAGTEVPEPIRIPGFVDTQTAITTDAYGYTPAFEADVPKLTIDFGLSGLDRRIILYADPAALLDTNLAAFTAATAAADAATAAADRAEAAVAGVEYQAVRHGVTTTSQNVAPALNTLIQTVNNAGGGTIVLPAGTLNVTSSIGLGTTEIGRVVLTGSGKQATTIKSAGDGDFPIISGRWTHSTIRNLTLDARDAWYDAIQVHIDHSTLEDLKVTNWHGKAVSLNDGTYYPDHGYLNALRRLDVSNRESGAGSFGIWTSYRFVDSVIERCYIEAEGTNISVEGVASRIIDCHLNGEPEHNLECRGSDFLLVSGCILDHSRKEAIRYFVPEYISGTVQASLQIVGNYISHASMSEAGAYDAISITGAATKRVASVLFSGNQIEGRDGITHRYPLALNYVDHVTAVGNMWWKGRTTPDPVNAQNATGVEVIGNHGDDTVMNGENLAVTKAYVDDLARTPTYTASWSGTVNLTPAYRDHAYQVTLTGATTLNLPTPGTTNMFVITLAVTGAYTLTIPGTKSAYDQPVTVTGEVGKLDVIQLSWIRSRWVATRPVPNATA